MPYTQDASDKAYYRPGELPYPSADGAELQWAHQHARAFMFDELFSEHLSFAGFHLRVDSFLQHFTLGISEHTPTNPDVTSAVYRRLDPEDHRIGGGHGTVTAPVNVYLPAVLVPARATTRRDQKKVLVLLAGDISTDKDRLRDITGPACLQLVRGEGAQKRTFLWPTIALSRAPEAGHGLVYLGTPLAACDELLGKSTRSYVVTLQQVHPDYTRASEIEQPRARTSWRLRFYRSDNAGLPRSGAPPDPSSSDAAPTFVLDVHYCRDFPCSDPLAEVFRGDVDLFDTFVQEMDAFLQRFTLGLSSNRPKDNAVTTSNFRFPVRWHRLGGIGSASDPLELSLAAHSVEVRIVKRQRQTTTGCELVLHHESLAEKELHHSHLDVSTIAGPACLESFHVTKTKRSSMARYEWPTPLLKVTCSGSEADSHGGTWVRSVAGQLYTLRGVSGWLYHFRVRQQVAVADYARQIDPLPQSITWEVSAYRVSAPQILPQDGTSLFHLNLCYQLGQPYHPFAR